MKTYLVRYKSTTFTEIRVKARNKDAAETKAEKILSNPDGREGQITWEANEDAELHSITEEVKQS